MLPSLSAADELALLMLEGDHLAADLHHRVQATPEQAERLQFIGRTLAVNLVRVFVQTIEDVTRKVGQPLRVGTQVDSLGRPELVVRTDSGEVRERMAVDGLLNAAFYQGVRLHPTIETHLRAAVQASNEHLATRAVVACLKSRPVLDLSLPYLRRYTR